jgi:hypothetical protein
MNAYTARPLLHPIPQPGETLSGFTRTSIYELLKQGRLEARKFGKRTLIVDESLRRLVDSLPNYKAT